MAETAVMEVQQEKESKRGRSELYPVLVEPRLDDIYEWISQGYTEKSICKKLGIHPFTWIRYKQDNNELSELIIHARQAAGQVVLNKQFQAACGQSVTLSKQKVTKDGEVIDITEEMYIPPNVNAAEFWGRHMMPDYKPAKSVENLTLIQNNFQLPDLQQQLQQIQEKRKQLESLLAVDLEPTE